MATSATQKELKPVDSPQVESPAGTETVIAKQEETSSQNTTHSFSQWLLKSAVENGVDVESLSKLVDLNEQMMAKAAEQEFNVALQSFQERCPPIPKNKKGHKGAYATLDHITETIRPLMRELGLSFTHDMEFKDDTVVTTCTIHHVSGHKQSSSFTAPIDKEARINDMQKTASASTYSRRYSLTNSLGITTADTDDDAFSVGESQRRERSGEAGEEEFNKIKRRFGELFKPQGEQQEKLRRFEKWVVESTGMKPALASNWSKWLPQNYIQLDDALDDFVSNTDPDFR